MSAHGELTGDALAWAGTTVAVALADLTGSILKVSPAMVSMFGWDGPAEPVGQRLSVYVSPEDRGFAAAHLTRVLAGELESALDYRALRKSGEEFLIRLDAELVRDDVGSPTGLSLQVLELTQEQRAASDLVRERSLLNALMDNTPDHIYFKDADGRFIMISRAQAIAFGLGDASEASGKTDFDFFTEEHARPAFEDERKVMTTGQPIVGLEEKETRLDGSVAWVSTTKLPRVDAHGRILGTMGVSRDITERKQTEQKLRESEEKYRTLVEKANEAICILQEGVFVFANPRMADLLGVPAAELEGHPILGFIFPDDRRVVGENYAKRIAGEPVGDGYDFRMIGAEGRTTWVYLSAAVIPWNGRPATLNLLSDVTARKTGGGGARADKPRPRGGHCPSRIGQPGQKRVPGQHEPRDPHSDERGDWNDRSPARHASSTRTSAGTPRPCARAASPFWPCSTTSSTSPRSKPASSTLETLDFDLRVLLDDFAGLMAHAGPRPRPGIHLRPRSRCAVQSLGRPRAPPPGAPESRRQRRQVHRTRRGFGPGERRVGERNFRRAQVLGQRYGHRRRQPTSKT